MTTHISGTTGVDKHQDGSVTNDDLAGGITSSKFTGNAVPLGVGQTWQDVSGSRVSGTTYTNDTGRPILVSVISTTGALTMIGVVSGLTVMNTVGAAGVRMTGQLLVPAGATYSVTASNSLFTSWMELR